MDEDFYSNETKVATGVRRVNDSHRQPNSDLAKLVEH